MHTEDESSRPTTLARQVTIISYRATISNIDPIRFLFFFGCDASTRFTVIS